MKFEELKKEAETDLNLTEANIKEKALEISRIYAKWLNYFKTVSSVYTKIEDEKRSKYMELYSYYRNDYEIKLKNNELDIYIKADDNYQEINQRLSNYKTILEYIDGVLKEVSRMNFNIKNYIEWQKFENGVL